MKRKQKIIFAIISAAIAGTLGTIVDIYYIERSIAISSLRPIMDVFVERFTAMGASRYLQMFAHDFLIFFTSILIGCILFNYLVKKYQSNKEGDT